MSPIAFLSVFTGAPVRNHHPQTTLRRRPSPPSYSRRRFTPTCTTSGQSPSTWTEQSSQRQTTRPQIAIVAKTPPKPQQVKEVVIDLDEARKGIFGMKAKAYWDGMGVLPLFFAGFGLTALAIKMLKLKGGELRAGPSAVNKLTVPKTAITSVEEEAELHVFKCGGCGYEIYPARGREFKFFPDSFKCPLCSTPKSEFWDLNDPDDPRNQQSEDEDDENDENDEQSSEESEESKESESGPSSSSETSTEGSLEAPDSSDSASKDSNPPPSS